MLIHHTQQGETLVKHMAVKIAHLGIGQILSKHVACRHTPLLDGVVPMLNTVLAIQHLIVKVSHIAGSKNMGIIGAKKTIHTDAVVQLEATGFQELDVRLYPCAHHNQVAGDGSSCRGGHRLDHGSALK